MHRASISSSESNPPPQVKWCARLLGIFQASMCLYVRGFVRPGAVDTATFRIQRPGGEETCFQSEKSKHGGALIQLSHSIAATSCSRYEDSNLRIHLGLGRIDYIAAYSVDQHDVGGQRRQKKLTVSSSAQLSLQSSQVCGGFFALPNFLLVEKSTCRGSTSPSRGRHTITDRVAREAKHSQYGPGQPLYDTWSVEQLGA